MWDIFQTTLDLTNGETTWHLTAIAIIIGLVAVISIITFCYMLLKAGKLKYPSLLIISIAMLSGIGMIAYAITDHQDLTSLVGVGLGALAAALTHDRTDRNPESRTRSTDEPQDIEIE